jgi:hypothetical protein
MTNVHRLPGRVLALAIGFGLLIAALVGILLAVGNSKPQPPSLTGSIQNGVLARAASAPPLLGSNPLGGGGGGANGGGGGTGGGGGATGSLSVATISLSPPRGWTVTQKNNISLTLEDPAKSGVLGLLSGTLKGQTTSSFAQSLVESIFQGTTNPDICGTITNGAVPNGPQGVVVPLCYTVVPQNGQAVQLYTLLVVAVSGNLGMVVKFVTPAQSSVLKAFINESSPLLSTIRWRLLT